MKLRNLIWLFVMLLAEFSFGQEGPVKFSLDEAISYSMEHNKTLMNARADVSVADEKIKEARSSGLPKVDGTVDYMTNFNYEFNLSFSGGSSEPPDIDYSLLDPGDYQVLDAINQMFGSSDGSAIVMEDQANAQVQVSQLIFSGQYWVGLQMSKLARDISEKNVNVTELDVKEQVSNAYYLILMTQELLKVIDENTQNLQEIYRHTNNMYKLGAAEQTDADLIRIQLSQLENSKNATERNLEYNFNMLKFLLGLKTDAQLTLTDNFSALVSKVEINDFTGQNFDVNLNPGYQILSMQEDISNKQVDMQKWAYSPTLVGFYSYTKKILTSGFDLSPTSAAGFTLNVPIFAGGLRKSQLNQAMIALDQTRRDKTLLEEQLRLQDKQLIFNLRSAYDNYVTQKENVEVALRVFESYQNKYKQGLVSSLDLTQSNNSYLQAQSNFISAMLQLLQSKLAIDKLYNRI